MFGTGATMNPKVCYGWKSWFVICFIAFTLVAPLHAAGPRIERIGALAAVGASDEIKKTIEDKGYRITLDDGWTAEFWFARALATATKDSPGALYPDLSNGEFVGVASFPKGSNDYRGQAIPAGTYALRYQYLPQDANHMGVSPNPDFLLAIPVALDTNPAEPVPYKKLVSLSMKASGTAHPAVIAMSPAGESATVVKDDQGMTVLTVAVPTAAAGKTEKLGIVLKGQASQ
jgi:hypothetical protein